MLALLKINSPFVYHTSPCKSIQLVFCKTFPRICGFVFPLHVLLDLADPAVHCALFCIPSEQLSFAAWQILVALRQLKKGTLAVLFLFWVPDIPSGLRFCKTSKNCIFSSAISNLLQMMQQFLPFFRCLLSTWYLSNASFFLRAQYSSNICDCLAVIVLS